MGAWGSWNLAFCSSRFIRHEVPIAGFVDRVPMIEDCKLLPFQPTFSTDY
jgi:hypothetical protein